MTENEAVETAYNIAKANGWPWIEPVRVVKSTRWLRKPSWVVKTNTQQRGCNVVVEIDDATGSIIKSIFLAR